MADEIKLPPEALGTGKDAPLITTLEAWFEESKKWMDKQRKRWQQNEKLYYNEVEVPGPKEATKLQFALPLSVISTEIAIIADYLPTFDIQPESENDQFFADQMQKRKGQLERDIKLRDLALDCITDSLIYSDGITGLHPVFDEEGALQTIEVEVVDLFTWFPAPGSTGMDIRKNSRYQIFAVPKHVDEIKRLYGIEAQGEGYLDEYQSFKKGDTDGSGTTTTYALVKECYRMDENLEKYPNGRATIWCEQQVIHDGPIKTKRMPYFQVSNYKTSHSPFGVGETFLVRTQTKTINQIMSSIADNINQMGRPLRKIVRSLWATMTNKIKGIAGEEIIVNQPSDLTYETPPGVPGSYFQFIEIVMSLTDVVTGIHDVTQGRRPTGITSGVAIAELQEAAQGRVRYKLAKEINAYFRDIGQYTTEILQKWDKKTRSIREQADEGGYTFHEYNPTGTFDKNGNPEGHVDFDAETAHTMSDSKFDIEVVSGARLPAGRLASEQRAVNLYKEGIYGIEETVMALAEGNKQKIVENYYRRQGIQQLVQYQDERNKAFAEFEKMVDAVLEDPAAWMQNLGTPEGIALENEIVLMLLQYPDFLNTDSFKILPEPVRQRLLIIFDQDPESMVDEAEQKNQQPQEDVADQGLQS